MEKIITLYSMVDESVFLSLLESAGIAAVTDATNFSRAAFGTLFTDQTGVTVSVEEADEAEAREIAADFLASRKTDSGATSGQLPKLLP
jgi:hypothetical protein